MNFSYDRSAYMFSQRSSEVFSEWGFSTLYSIKMTVFSLLMWILFPDEEVIRFIRALANNKFILMMDFREVRSVEENLFVVKDESL